MIKLSLKNIVKEANYIYVLNVFDQIISKRHDNIALLKLLMLIVAKMFFVTIQERGFFRSLARYISDKRFGCVTKTVRK